MKISDFKLLCELPEEYEYEIFTQSEGNYLVIGKKDSAIIGFYMQDKKLIPIPMVDE